MFEHLAISMMIATSGISMPAISKAEVECLAKNVYHEARNQSVQGQFAVTHVVLNRVKSDRYPNTPCKVIKQAKVKWGVPVIDACQFSWFCDGKPDVPLEKDVWNRSLQVALDAYMVHHIGLDVTDGATHYHAVYVKPWWRKHYEKVAKIGDHIFYRPRPAT